MITLSFFILGLIIGSFLNVVAWRLPKGEQFWRGHSHCPHCQKKLTWLELIPVFSFLWQGGRCRGCQKNISFRYVVMELATGGLFAGTYYFLASQNLVYFWPTLIFYLIIVSVLEIIFLIDWQDRIILDILIWPFVVLSILFWLFTGMGWLNHLLAGLGCAAFFGMQFLSSKGRWIGSGDIGLGFLLGIFLGHPLILIALYFSYVVGAISGLLLVAIRKKNWFSELPFAIFLIPGALFALFWGQIIWQWWLGFVGHF
ncbi:MAG TPA: prepilin peptidase [Candidatus Magasanikbacteria bacterium]|nr:prepilin peptidase [Candidatus Magasanikbacteria bacterium]